MDKIFKYKILFYFLYFFVAAFILFLINRIIIKIINCNSLRSKIEKKQKGLLINKNKYICCDLNELECKSEINKRDKIVIIAPDLFEPLFIYDDFIGYLSHQDICDYFIYKQRNMLLIQKEKRVLGNYLEDLLDIINYFKEKNYYKEIVLITSGLFANLSLTISNKNIVDKIIVLNYANKGFKYENKYAMKLHINTILFQYNPIPCKLDKTTLSGEKLFDKKIIEYHLEFAFFSSVIYYQMLKAIKKFYNSVNKSKAVIYFKNSKNNNNLNAKKFVKMLSFVKSEYEVEIFNDSSNFFLNDAEKLIVFNSIISII
ncbi:hypothetical protein [Spiroplasma endosymbiont of Aspidapion aeneum]|uniref:hypothetical protein n=1 Tax=Spiroplasma endosymbiont of Aspidapion aeneum TaxID=3066276 RepID=UPI00313BC412